MPDRNNGTIRGFGCLAIVFAVSACSAIPTAEEYQLKRAGIDTNDAEAVQAYANQTGQGTIIEIGGSYAKCDRRRSTGSNIGKKSCRSVDIGSQPTRKGRFIPQPPMITPDLLNRGSSN